MGALSIVSLLFSRDVALVNFHARQGIVFWIWLVHAIFALQAPSFAWSFGV